MSRLSPAALDRLASAQERYDAISRDMSDPETFSDPSKVATLGREQAELQPVVHSFEQYRQAADEATQAEDILRQADDEDMKALAREEMEVAESRIERFIALLQRFLQPSDPNDFRDVIMELRGAEGGQEANLWAADLYRMYVKYAEIKGWKIEEINKNETDLGGLKEITFEVRGRGAYSRLKWEGGTHRVQRVPATEAQGRIHTSTATVTVLPKAEEVDVSVREEDLRVDVYRASGHGGQGVNTTDSAVRLTHIPTGLVVTCQDERSQIKNKARALSVLRSRLFELELKRHMDETGQMRRSQVGMGERAEKIRTYNYRENRVTDHRANLTLHNLDRILLGDLDPLIDGVADALQGEGNAAATTAA